MDGEFRLIPCKDITVPKGEKLNESTLGYLRDSIQMEGMYNPIVVRPDPDLPDKFRVVQGRHRYHVKAKILKEDLIECRVFTDMDEDEARLASLTENVCRNNPNSTSRYTLIQEWQTIFRQKYPDLIGKRAGGKKRAEKQVARKKADDEPNNHHGDGSLPEAEAPQAADANGATFNQRVAQATGRSSATAERDIRIANGFSTEDLKNLETEGIGQGDLIAILNATKHDENARNEIVNLVCAHVPVADAIREVTGKDVVKEGGRIKERTDEEKAEASGLLPDLTDDEWFEKTCGDFAQHLADPSAYRRDAILFRHTSDARATFRKKTKKDYHEAREAESGRWGWLLVTFHTLLNLAHPKDWLLCDACKGGQPNENGEPCKKCGERGYFTKTEKIV